MASLRQLRGRRLSLRTVFIDDGGVLNDNRLRAPQYRRFIGEFISRRLGGTPDKWAEANRVVFPQLWEELQQRLTDFATHCEFQREYEIRWMKGMCSAAGTPFPTDDAAIALAREAAIYAATHVQAEIEGASDAIRALRRSGCTLHTASGTPSWELELIVNRMSIRSAFSNLYGPDVIDRVKYGATFYQRMFEHAHVTPSECTVVESCQRCCEWARDAGARAVWVDHEQGDVASLAEMVARAF